MALEFTLDEIVLTAEGRVRARVSAGDAYFYCETLPVRGLFTGDINVAATQRKLLEEFKRRQMERARVANRSESDAEALAGMRGVFREP